MNLRFGGLGFILPLFVCGVISVISDNLMTDEYRALILRMHRDARQDVRYTATDMQYIVSLFSIRHVSNTKFRNFHIFSNLSRKICFYIVYAFSSPDYLDFNLEKSKNIITSPSSIMRIIHSSIKRRLVGQDPVETKPSCVLVRIQFSVGAL